MYLVASLDIPDDVITLWRNYMERMISDGTYQRILKNYDVDSDFFLTMIKKEKRLFQVVIPIFDSINNAISTHFFEDAVNIIDSVFV